MSNCKTAVASLREDGVEVCGEGVMVEDADGRRLAANWDGLGDVRARCDEGSFTPPDESITGTLEDVRVFAKSPTHQ